MYDKLLKPWQTFRITLYIYTANARRIFSHPHIFPNWKLRCVFNITRNPHRLFSRPTRYQNMRLPYQRLLKRQWTVNPRTWPDIQNPACLNSPASSTYNLATQLSAGDGVQPRLTPDSRPVNSPTFSKTGLRDDAFAFLYIRWDSGLPAGRKVSASTEFQNPSSEFKDFKTGYW